MSQRDDLVGKRIELIAPMIDEPDPIPVGSQGVVVFAGDVDLAGVKYTQLAVKWDSGRSLGLASPPDRYRVIGELS